MFCTFAHRIIKPLNVHTDMFRHILYYVTSVFLLLHPYVCYSTDYKPDKETEKRIEALLGKMTLEEKIGQMNQLHCENFPYLKTETRKGRVGSVMSITDPNIFNEVQRIAVEDSRLGIPLINARDVIHGFKTIFPIPLGQAASFNPEIAETGARIAATEASAAGIRWTFAPMIDITHDPRWGRIAEGFGEDPLLVSQMGVAAIKGFQGSSLNHPTSIAACAKHFAGYGASEGGRDYNSTYITERQFRNLYLRPFEAAVNAGAATLMTAFNDNDGIPSSANPFLLKDVLRNEWNYRGTIVSDWASVSEMIRHGFCEDEKEAALKATNAGTDIEMVSETYIKYLPQLIKEGKVSMETIDNAVRNILRLKFRLGLFEHPYIADQRKETFYRPDFLEAAQTAAEQSAVLLKNERGTLPIQSNIKTILVTGPLADAPHEQLGTWVFDGDASYSQTPLQALRRTSGDSIKVLYAPGLNYSRDTVTSQFNRLAALSDALLEYVDNNKIPMIVGEKLSYLKPEEQGWLLEVITNSSIFPTKQQAEQLKECSANGKLNQSYIYAVLLKKENSKINVTIPAKKIGNYFPETYSKEQIEEVIFMLLDKWKQNREGVADAEDTV